MATVSRPGPFATKPVERLLETAEGTQLNRTVGALDLTAFGIGAIIGTGIFVIVGEAISESGPALVLSFVLAGVTCIFSALAYAELASSLPVSGSAYTYAYATMGEALAWIIGWDLILEYGVSVAAVAVGWGSYLKELLDSLFGITLPDSIALAPGEGGTVNVPAVVLVLGVAALLISGVRQSARSNTIMVITKLLVLAFFIVVAVTAFNGDHFSPFAPNGFSGIESAAALIFFAYIGFDAVSTGSEECAKPGRDLPIAIVGSLIICTVIYILVAVAAVGALPADQLAGQDAPLAVALSEGAGIGWGADIVSFGALIAITSVVLTILFGQTRVAFSMCRDGLLPIRLATDLGANQDPRDPHGAVRDPDRGPRGVRAAHGDRGTGEHRHPGRLLRSQHRRDLAAAHEAGHGPRLPRPARAGLPDHRRGAVRLPDDEAPARDLGALHRLASAGHADLRVLRLPQLAAAQRGGARIAR